MQKITMPNPPTKAELDAMIQRKKEKAIKKDIHEISNALQRGSAHDQLVLHKYLDGKYQQCIAGWGQSMWGHADGMGFNYELLGEDAIKENLELMEAKLEAFKQGWNVKSNSATPDNGAAINVNVSNTNTNSVNISLSFEEAKRRIDEMPGLPDKETEEIKAKIDTLEALAKEDSPKKKKWEKTKPILKYAIEKGADVAATLMTLVLQNKLGL